MGVLSFLATADLEGQINSLGLRTVLFSGLVLAACTIIAVLLKNRYKRLKLPLFLLMASSLIISTLVLGAGTVYLNVKSESKGPVHWHADIEFWACGSELNLRDPVGALTNKIGTATYHEHNDKRIHLEGVVVRKAEDASLEKFMRVTGGYITDHSIGIPLPKNESKWLASGDQIDGDKQSPDGLDQLRAMIKQADKGPVLELKNGDRCNGEEAELQTFLYHYEEKSKTYSQAKLDNPADYIMRDKAIVPPGDCVIVEFSRPKFATDKLCRQYGVRDDHRCEQFGVAGFNPELCNIHEDKTGGPE